MSETVTSEPRGQLTIRTMAMPADTNAAGDIFGGWVMAMVDVAGSVPAHRIAMGRIATVAVNSFVFRQPISVGDLVSFYATVTKVGTTSITVDVEVYAERNPEQPEVVKVTEATLTYVAVDEDGAKRQIEVGD